MHIFFSDQKIEWNRTLPSIFLAGPSPRHPEIVSWRIEAVKILSSWKFKGIVLVPERHNWACKFDFTDQVEWEFEGLYGSSAAAFWIPRNMKHLPGLTTNVEFGALVANKEEARRVVYGRPDESEKNRYLDWFFNKHTGKNPCRTLEETLEQAVALASLQHMMDAAA